MSNDCLMPFEAAGLEFRNNLIVASGPTVKNIGMIREIEAAGWGGASLKLALDPVYVSKPPRYRWRKKAGYHAFTAETRLRFDESLRLMEAARKETRELILSANMSYAGDDPDIGWAEMAKKYEAAGAHVIELNMCCPNMSFNVTASGGDIAASSGASVGSVPELVARAVETVRSAVSIPVFVKLTPEGGRIAEVAKACFRAGAASAGTTANRLAIVDFDLTQPEKGIYDLQDEPTLACMSGPWVRPLALRDVYEIRSLVGPEPLVMGSGGVESWRDALRFMMCGADFVQICTATMIHGFGIVKKIASGMGRFMEDQGYSSYRDLRDAVVTHITPTTELTIYDGHSVINAEKCTGCGLCVKIGHCSAIEMIDEKAVVNQDDCTGCATCTDVCPVRAASMIKGEKL